MQKFMTLGLVNLLIWAISATLVAQADPAKPAIIQVRQALQQALQAAGAQQDEAATKPDEKPAEEKDTGPVVATADMIQESSLTDQQMRIHMWDGSIVGGELQAQEIVVKTEFGMLQIPINRIVRFFPGLDSFPEMTAQLDSLVEQLGDKEFENRESAHRKLASMGRRLRFEINRFDDGGSAERKKHLDNLKNEIEQMISDEEEFDTTEAPADRALIRGDTVVTPEFTVVGKIQEEMFVLKNKFGVLNVPLGDILMGDRGFSATPDQMRKTVSVDGHSFFQNKPTSTKIRVSKGDKIQIRASGTINWTNWGNVVATPEGVANQGNWKEFVAGTLLARVGDSGKVVKVGNQAEFVASENGVLYLAIAMRDSYANNSGYRWVGSYKAKILIQPAAKE